VGRRRNPSPRNLAPVKTTRYDLTRDDLASMLEGEPRYRVDQIWTGLYEHKLAPEELSTLPKSLRSRLVEELPSALAPVTESVSDDGDTVKWLWSLSDGASIETVLMHYRDRSTVCVSTQAGCAMACGFCATGQAGFERNLSVGEIVEQVVIAARRANEGTPSRRLSNVVFMGMGEPMANYDRVIGAVTRIHGDLGLSARHLTISTVGIIPGIRRLAAEPLPVNLAVSLHAANDTLRDELVPINRRYPIRDLVAACGDYLEAKNRRLSFEWALIGDVNDRDSDILELAAIARDLRAHVNLIPLNATPGWPTVGSSPERVKVFCERLCDLGVNATVRANRGTEIDAACGQLRASHEIGKNASGEITLGATRRGTSDEA
jgi:23S rRNA (adenine2503-C2)-methyltransferase